MADELNNERKAAEHEYSVSAFDYAAQPIGSRDWCLYWDGWQAAFRAQLARNGAQGEPVAEIINVWPTHNEAVIKYSGNSPCIGDKLYLAPQQVSEDRADHDESVLLLAAIFDAWENGTECYKSPEDYSGYLGTAFRLDDDIFNRCILLLNRLNPPKNAAPQAPEARAAVPKMINSAIAAIQAIECPYNEKDHGVNWHASAHVWDMALIRAIQAVHGASPATTPLPVQADRDGDAPTLSDEQCDQLAKTYFADEWAQKHLKNAIHDAFVLAHQSSERAASPSPSAPQVQETAHPAPQAGEQNASAAFCDGHCCWTSHHPDCVFGKSQASTKSENGGAP